MKYRNNTNNEFTVGNVFGYYAYPQTILELIQHEIIPSDTKISDLCPNCSNHRPEVYQQILNELPTPEIGLNCDPPGDTIDGVVVDPFNHVYFSSSNTGYIYKYQYDESDTPSYTYITKYGLGYDDHRNISENSLFGDCVWYWGYLYCTDMNPYPTGGDLFDRKLWIIDTTSDESILSPEDAIVGNYNIGKCSDTLSESQMWGIGIDRSVGGNCNQGRLFICDNDGRVTDAIHVYDIDPNDPTKLTFMGDIIGLADHQHRFHDLMDIAVDNTGNLYILDAELGIPDSPGGRGVKVFKKDGDVYNPVYYNGTPLLLSNGKLEYARSIEIDSEYRIYLTTSRSIIILSPIQ